jgi:hypothetical protein
MDKKRKLKLEPSVSSGSVSGPQESGVTSSLPGKGATLKFIGLCLVITLLLATAVSWLYVYFYSNTSTLLTIGKGAVFLAGIEKLAESVYSFLSNHVDWLKNKNLRRWLREQYDGAGVKTRWIGVSIIAIFGIVAPIQGLPHFFDPYTHTGFCLPGDCSVSFASWQDTSATRGGCALTDSTYKVTQSGKFQWRPCFSDAVDYGNFIYQAHMIIERGDCGGLLFRAKEEKSDTYQFEVCRTGQYSLYYYNSNARGPNTFTPSTCTAPNGSKASCALVNNTAAAVMRGTGQKNLLAVEANGSTIALYVNHILLTSVTDKKFTSGHIGTFAAAYQDQTDVKFSDITVWPL